jgi:hypothetical protein
VDQLNNAEVSSEVVEKVAQMVKGKLRILESLLMRLEMGVNTLMIRS